MQAGSVRKLVAACAVLLAVAGAVPAVAQTPSTTPTPSAPGSRAAPQSAPGTAPAAAPRRHRRTMTQMFQDANTTGDGHLTREQAAAKMPAVARDFDAIDKDKKGYVTLDDIRAHRREVRAQRRAARTGSSGSTAAARTPSSGASTSTR